MSPPAPAQAARRQTGSGVTAGNGHRRDLSGSSRASGPVASAAHATASGLSRNDRRRAIASSPSSRRAVVGGPCRRKATRVCAAVSPPGSRLHCRRRKPSPSATSRPLAPGGRSARSQSSAHSRGGRRRRPLRSRSSSLRLRTGGHGAGRPPRVLRSDGLDALTASSTLDVGSTRDRASAVQPHPVGRSGSGALGEEALGSRSRT